MPLPQRHWNYRMPRKIVARRSAIHGNGVFAIAPIAKGERLIEYKGRRRTHDEVDAAIPATSTPATPSCSRSTTST